MIPLLEKSSRGALGESDIRKLESLIREFPWFQAPYQALALHYNQTAAPWAGEWKLKAAAHSCDRLVLSALFAGHFSLVFPDKSKDFQIQPSEIEISLAQESIHLDAPEFEKETPELALVDTLDIPESGTELIEIEPETVSISKFETPVQPVLNTSPAINWGLNMKLKIRSSQYKELSIGLLNQMKEFSLKNGAGSASVSTQKTPGAEAKKVAPVQEKVVSKNNQAETKKVETKPKPIAQPSQKDEMDTLAAGYSIGAFSGFSFIDPKDDSPDSPEKKTPISNVSSENELVIEETNRILEIKVTPEQRARYFSSTPTPPAEKPLINLPKPTKEEVAGIVEKFIQQDPRIGSPDAYKPKNFEIGKESLIEDENLISETLAKIYAKQGKSSKAIKIYERLILLFPSRKDIFAIQIEKLKKQ